MSKADEEKYYHRINNLDIAWTYIFLKVKNQ